MDSENCSARCGSGLVALVPLIVLGGAIAGIGCRKRHSHGGEGHDGCKCGHREGGHCRQCGHEHGSVHEHVHGRHGVDPMRILDQRFAAGEIDEDDYLRRRTVLKENS